MASALLSEKVRVLKNLPLPELACVLQNCALFIGHDSGISHLAAAVGAPCLLLFGPTDPAIWAPQNPQVRVLRSPDLTMGGLDLGRVLETIEMDSMPPAGIRSADSVQVTPPSLLERTTDS